MSDRVRFGFFQSFRFDDNTILFFGTAAALAGLRDALLSLRTKSPLTLEDDGRFMSLNNTSITVSLSNDECGMHRVDPHTSGFTW